MACEVCHSIGKPNQDGSTGNCNKCHLRHEFSLATVRKPETCNACHIGPDHPQWEIYQESYHGILYATQGERWNWEQSPRRLTVKDFPAPTCAICHISGLGNAGTTHDVGERLSYFLFAEISELRPSASENRARMKEVCTHCYSKNFVEEEFQKADNVTASINEKVKETKSIMDNLTKSGIITDKLFFAIVALIGMVTTLREDPKDSGKLHFPYLCTIHFNLSKNQILLGLVGLCFDVITLTTILDHAQYGYTPIYEWIPILVGIFSTAVVISFTVFQSTSLRNTKTYFWTMFLNLGIGFLGFGFHLVSLERLLSYAPIFAPMLFSNIGLLGLIAISESKEV